MKKTLIALAVAGALAAPGAQAQTNVTIGGVLQANFKSYSIGSSTRVTERELHIDDDYNSRFWLAGTEDLGGGLSALFYVENRLNLDMGSTGVGNGLSAGDSYVGLKGGWGQLTAGRHTMFYGNGLLAEVMTPSGITAMPSSMWGTLTILNEFNGTYLDVTRRNNSAVYRTPNLNGFAGVIGWAASGSNTSEGTAPAAGGSNYNDGREWYLSGTYTNGPLWLNLAYRKADATGRPAAGLDDKQWRASGYYKLQNFKFGLQLDRATRTVVGTGASTSRTAWELPLSYSFGNNTILGSYTHAGDVSGTSSTGAKLWVLGWDYALSKRTIVGVYYSKLANDSGGLYQPFLAGLGFTGSALAAGESAQTFALGIKHTF